MTTSATTADALLASLDPEQRAAAESRALRLFVLAGPGSGKSRTLTARIVHLLQVRQVPSHCLVAFAFTRAAAATIRGRVVEAVGPDLAALLTVTTFHGFACSVLRRASRETLAARQWPTEPWRVADEEEAEEALRGLFRGPRSRPEAKRTGINAVREASMIHAAYRRWGTGPQWELLKTWWRRLADQGLVHPDRLLPAAAAVLERQDERARYDEVRHVLIDEGQDLTRAEWEMATSLGAEPPAVCVVADERQAIFGWRGATALPDLIEEAGPDGSLVPLSRSYRCSAAVAAYANQIGDALRTSSAQIRPVDGEPGLVEQGMGVEQLRTVVGLLAGRYGPGNVAVLARTNRECEDAASVIGLGVSRLIRRDPDEDLRVGIALMRLYERPTDNAAARVVLVNLGVLDLDGLASRAGAARGLWEQALAEGRVESWEDAWEACGPAVRAVAAATGTDASNPREALDALADLQDADQFAEAAGAGKVAVATVHAAKGREWDAVVLLTSRDWPGPRPRPEELRVAFVAATRARRHLVILEG